MTSPLLEFRNVAFAYPGHDSNVLDGVSFSVPRGGTEIILGGSGSGKSTILKLALGLIRPEAGEILVNGNDIGALSESALMPVRAGIGMVFQESALFDSMTVADNVGFRLAEHEQLDDEEIEDRVRKMLGFVELSDFYERMPSELSGGQRRRVAVARAMAHRPALILYDEPTAGLDPITASNLCDLIVRLRDLEGVTSVLVTHELQDAFQIANSSVVREDNELVYRRYDPASRANTEFLMLLTGRLIFRGSRTELVRCDEPYVRRFLDRESLAMKGKTDG